MRGPLDLLVLATLARTGSSHGYALIVALRDSTEGVLDLAEGTVYPALHRLERDGWVGSAWSAEAGRRRRVYSITAEGRTALAAKKRDWSRLVDVVARVTGPLRKARTA